jgi:hypothetical protein
MFQRKMASLPIKVIVHVEDLHFLQIDPLAIHSFSEDWILPTRSAGKDPTRRLIRCIVALNLIDHRGSDVLIDFKRLGQNSEFNF